jgi:hypothetical protein
MNDGDHISKKKLMSKNHHNATCQILIDGWQSMTSHDIMGAIIMKLHNSWKWIILIELQLSYNELHHIYNELQLMQLVH